MPQIGCKLQDGNGVTVFLNDMVKLFWRCFFSLVKFSCWSKFHVNIIVGSGVMTISFYKGLTRNSENGNTPSDFCPLSGDWDELGLPNLTRTPLIKCYWMLPNARVTAFTVYLLKNNQEGGKTTPLHPD